MKPRFNLSRNYYEIIKDPLWPSYDKFLSLDLESFGPDVQNELLDHINIEPKYHSSLKNYFRFPFNGLSLIQEHFSQSWQDLFVLSVLDGKVNGSYLEIGAGWPLLNNNTYLLSSVFGYTGPSIDIDLFQAESEWRELRSNSKFIKQNALEIDYISLLKETCNNQIDYLQIDIDPQEANVEILYKLPFDQYQFAVITFETDVFRGNTNGRDESRAFFHSLGYQLLIKDVAVKNWESNTWEPFEDWYVNPRCVKQNTIEKFMKYQQKETNLPHEIFIQSSKNIWKR